MRVLSIIYALPFHASIGLTGSKIGWGLRIIAFCSTVEAIARQAEKRVLPQTDTWRTKLSSRPRALLPYSGSTTLVLD